MEGKFLRQKGMPLQFEVRGTESAVILISYDVKVESWKNFTKAEKNPNTHWFFFTVLSIYSNCCEF